VPASLSLLRATFTEAEERNRAIGVYGAMAALGFVLGMVGGGVITDFLGWRWLGGSSLEDQVRAMRS
jgi:MFS family permease